MSSELQWWHIVVPLFTGGAFGALITAIVTTYRNRIQPVGYRRDIRPVFTEGGNQTSLAAKITIYDDSKEFTFHNLFIIQFLVVNKGNKDIEEFPIGFTLSEGDKAVWFEVGTLDRHHETTPSGVGPDNPKSEIDIMLQPFNRGDLYVLGIYVVIPEGRQMPGMIKVSSPYPVRFISMPTIRESAEQAASSASIAVGPIRITISGR